MKPVGQAFVSAESPFESVGHGGREICIGQCISTFIIPGMGLGALVAEVRSVTNRMFRCSAGCLAQHVLDGDLAAGAFYPLGRDLRRVSMRIAETVVRKACDSGVARAFADDAMPRAVREAQWEPVYRPFA